jgi:hypothetical protein
MFETELGGTKLSAMASNRIGGIVFAFYRSPIILWIGVDSFE